MNESDLSEENWWPLEEEELAAIETRHQEGSFTYSPAEALEAIAEAKRDVRTLVAEVRNLERVIFGLRRRFGTDPNWPDEAENVWSKDHA